MLVWRLFLKKLNLQKKTAKNTPNNKTNFIATTTKFAFKFLTKNIYTLTTNKITRTLIVKINNIFDLILERKTGI